MQPSQWRRGLKPLDQHPSFPTAYLSPGVKFLYRGLYDNILDQRHHKCIQPPGSKTPEKPGESAKTNALVSAGACNTCTALMSTLICRSFIVYTSKLERLVATYHQAGVGAADMH